MKLGVSLPVFTADPSRPLGGGGECAELGFDGVFSPDHLFPPVFYPPSGPDRPALESFTLARGRRGACTPACTSGPSSRA